tara:strand:+ start:3650 stop:3883 length:234 start_codon:yes stop_codon:yes gene_type:complete
MIDTDKYEGHTEGPWKLDDRVKEMYLGLEADVVLMQDAPLLLAEVKRLRKGIIGIADKWEQPSIIRGFLKELKELIE